jgi:hypothetical protein
MDGFLLRFFFKKKINPMKNFIHFSFQCPIIFWAEAWLSVSFDQKLLTFRCSVVIITGSLSNIRNVKANSTSKSKQFFVRRYKSRALWYFFLKKCRSKIPGHFPFRVTGEWTLGRSVIRFRRTLHKHSIANFAAEFPEKQGQCSGNSVSARNYKFPLQCWWKFEMKVICSASQRSPGPSHTTRLTIHTVPDSQPLPSLTTRLTIHTS